MSADWFFPSEGLATFTFTFSAPYRAYPRACRVLGDRYTVREGSWCTSAVLGGMSGCVARDATTSKYVDRRDTA